MTNEFKYRPEVDGLRAVAIALVLLFHADLGLPGGYIGVDVFFVVSGFLITGLLLRDLEAGTLNLGDFWSRRIRRIIPAAFVMTVSVLISGFVLLLPLDYLDLGKSAIAQQLMVSNFYFWRTTGYFGGAAEIKPLLHTWSLAVEEQFYLVYPLFLRALYGWGRRATIGVLVAVTLGSLALSEYGARYYPGPTFYAMPTRAWELLVGGLVWFLPKPSRIHPKFLEGTSWLCLIAILWAGIAYSSNTTFPGLSALMPCVAATFFIYANSECRSSAAVLLSKPPIVAIGLISYSLYLWHWPVLAFYRYWFVMDLRKLSYPESLGLLSVSVVLGSISWRLIEVPFRHSPKLKIRRMTFRASFAASAMCLMLASIVVSAAGLPGRVPSEARRYHAASTLIGVPLEAKRSMIDRNELASAGDPTRKIACLLWGDSHAMALAPGLDEAGKELGFRTFLAVRSNTPPILDFVPKDIKSTKDTAEFNNSVLAWIKRSKVDLVILANNWSREANSDAGMFANRLRQTVIEIGETGARVCIVLDVANQQFDVPRLYALRAWRKQPSIQAGILVEEHRRRNAKADAVIHQIISSSKSVSSIDPTGFFSDDQGMYRSKISDIVMYRAGAHLSVEGARSLGNFLKEKLGPVLGLE